MAIDVCVNQLWELKAIETAGLRVPGSLDDSLSYTCFFLIS